MYGKLTYGNSMGKNGVLRPGKQKMSHLRQVESEDKAIVNLLQLMFPESELNFLLGPRHGP